MKRDAWRSFPVMVTVIAVVFWPSVAWAHLVNTGLGPFYDGALHLVLSPMDMVWLVTLSLFAGAQVSAGSRIIVIVATCAWFLAGIAGLAFVVPVSITLINGIALFLLGILVALDIRLPLVVLVAVAAVFGALPGYQTGIELHADGAGWMDMAGTTMVVLILLLLVTSAVISVTAFAARVVCRTLGSWTAATGLLSIGWAIAAS